MHRHRYLIAALVCFTLAALILACGVAGAQTVTVLAGVGMSGNLGEHNPGYQAQAIAADRHGALAWESSARFDTTDKYTGGGYALNGVFDVSVLSSRDVGLVAGVEYVYRDGGPWVKQGAWLRAGIEGRRECEVIRVIARATLAETDDTNSRIVQVEYRRRFGRWWVLGEGGVVWYRQAGSHVGFYSALRVGLQVK